MKDAVDSRLLIRISAKNLLIISITLIALQAMVTVREILKLILEHKLLLVFANLLTMILIIVSRL